jgi:hypothetical protein
MNEQNSRSIIDEAERIYAERLKAELELSNPNDFVAIEPISGEYFVAPTLSEAVAAARKAYPARLSYALRVGHKTTVHLGTCFS